MRIKSIFTAFASFVSSINAMRYAVTSQVERDALTVKALEFFFGAFKHTASRRLNSGSSTQLGGFVRSIHAVVQAIANPRLVDVAHLSRAAEMALFARWTALFVLAEFAFKLAVTSGCETLSK